MATYAVESERQPMTATGIVEAVREWEEGADGKRRPSTRQGRHEGTGMPLWGVEVLYVTSSFGRPATVTARVTVGAAERPAVAPLTAITFVGLVVEARTNKAGGLVESWSAEAITSMTAAASNGAPGSDPTGGPAGGPARSDAKTDARAA